MKPLQFIGSLFLLSLAVNQPSLSSEITSKISSGMKENNVEQTEPDNSVRTCTDPNGNKYPCPKSVTP
jgi:hypothetical protein